MRFIRLKDDIVIFVKNIQAINIAKAGKQKMQDGTLVDTKPIVSVMLTMNSINTQFDTDEQARAQYEAILKSLELADEKQIS